MSRTVFIHGNPIHTKYANEHEYGEREEVGESGDRGKLQHSDSSSANQHEAKRFFFSFLFLFSSSFLFVKTIVSFRCISCFLSYYITLVGCIWRFGQQGTAVIKTLANSMPAAADDQMEEESAITLC